jgi:hypothetical protein
MRRNSGRMPDADDGGQVRADIPRAGCAQGFVRFSNRTKIKRLFSLDDQNTICRRTLANAGDKVQHFRFALKVERIRRTAENQPRDRRRGRQCGQITLGPEKRARNSDGRLCLQSQCTNIFGYDMGCRNMLLDECAGRRAAADRFKSEGARAGEQVDCVSAIAAGADKVEDRFARALLHGPHDRIAMIMQSSAAKLPAHDADFCIAVV